MEVKKPQHVTEIHTLLLGRSIYGSHSFCFIIAVYMYVYILGKVYLPHMGGVCGVFTYTQYSLYSIRYSHCSIHIRKRGCVSRYTTALYEILGAYVICDFSDWYMLRSRVHTPFLNKRRIQYSNKQKKHMHKPRSYVTPILREMVTPVYVNIT